MNTLVLQHVPVAELPESWRSRLQAAGDSTVTVRIEPEMSSGADVAGDPLFGMWRDRRDMSDVAGYIREQRRSRFDEDSAEGAP